MAFPVTLNGRTYTLADFAGTSYVEGLPDAFEDFVTQAGSLYSTTSTTSNAIGTGSKTFTVEASKPYQVGTPLRIADTAAPSTNWIDGIVTAYSGTTLTVNAVAYAGSGTKTAWSINIGGGPIAYTGTLPVAQGGTGATTAADARTNLDVYSKSEADGRYLNISGDTADISFGANMTFGDNNKAIFGAGSDLQIYHDGSNSVIKDNGTGNLLIQGATDIVLEDTSGANYFRGVSGSYVRLYHNNSTKLETTSTGIDVTGTVTADGLTVESSTGAIAKIGRSDTAIALNDVLGQLDFTTDDASTTEPIRGQVKVISDGTSGNSSLYISTASSDTLSNRIKVSFDGDISFYEDTGTTPKMVWKSADERLGIGTSSPSAPLHIQNGSSGGSANAAADELIIESSGSGGLTISTPSTGVGTIAFGDESVTIQGRIEFDHTDNAMAFYTSNSTERLRIDASGNLLVGKTSSDFGATKGIEMYQTATDSVLFATRSSNPAIVANRLTDDGPIVQLSKDGTTVGSIGNSHSSGHIGIFSPSSGIGCYSSGIYPINGAGSASDNSKDLGSLSVRWDDVYATNGTIQTSDANEKQDIAELDEAEKRVAVAAKGLIRKYRWKDAVAEKGDDARIHVGIIAQDLQAAFAAEGLDAGRYAMFISSTWWEKERVIPAIEAQDAVYEDVVIPAVLDDEGNEIEPETTETRLVSEAIKGQEERTVIDHFETAEEAPEGATERTRLGVRYPELLAFIIGAL